MSTDDEMDGLLREAGAVWRAANPGSARTVDFQTTPAAPASHLRRWLVMASAAALVAAVAVGATWLSTHRDNTQAVGPVDTPSPTQALTGTHWTIATASLDHPSNSGTLRAVGSSASLKINTDGTFVGDDGINSVSGSVTIDATSLDLSNVAISAVGSTDPTVGALANAIDSILQGDVTWSVTGAGTAAELTIVRPGVGSLTCSVRPTATVLTDPSKVPGTWELIAVDQTSGSTGSSQSSTYGERLLIATNSTFQVQNRCYTNSGDVTIGSGTAVWSKVHLAVASPCPATQTQQAEQVVNAAVDSALKGATSWQIAVNADLTITQGGTTLVYAPVRRNNGKAAADDPSQLPEN